VETNACVAPERIVGHCEYGRRSGHRREPERQR
jgi:hypothetical protein